MRRSPGSPRKRKGSGALEEEIGVWNFKEEVRTNIFYSTFLSFSHIKSVLFFFFFKPGTDDYTTNNSV